MREGWKSCKLGEVTILIKRGIAPKYVESNGYFILNQKCIRDKKISYDDSRLTSFEKKIAKEKFVQKGDTLVNSTGTGTLGRTGYLKTILGETTVDTHVTIVRPDPNVVEPSFLGQLLNYNEPYIENLGKGATNQIELSASDLASMRINLPPLETQKKIAGILSGYDDLIENNLKRIKILEEMAQQTYEEWFVRMRFPGYESAAIDTETGLPQGWEREYFKNILNFRTGKLDSNALDANGEFDFYTCAKEVYKTNTYCFEGEAVLLGGNNATGDFALFYANSKFDAYQRTYIVTSKCERLPLVYIYQVLRTYLPHFKVVSSGASTKFLTMRILDKTKVVVPNTDILNCFYIIVKPCYDNILNLTNQNQRLREARDILLPRLMSGMIEV